MHAVSDETLLAYDECLPLQTVRGDSVSTARVNHGDVRGKQNVKGQRRERERVPDMFRTCSGQFREKEEWRWGRKLFRTTNVECYYHKVF